VDDARGERGALIKNSLFPIGNFLCQRRVLERFLRKAFIVPVAGDAIAVDALGLAPSRMILDSVLETLTAADPPFSRDALSRYIRELANGDSMPNAGT